jgi:hypothetical protein
MSATHARTRGLRQPRSTIQPPSSSPGPAADLHQPGLMWIAPADGRYRLTSHRRISSAVPEAETTMTVTRNSHSDLIQSETLVLTATPYDFQVGIDAVEGDAIVLSATATTELGISVGVNFFVTGPMIP